MFFGDSASLSSVATNEFLSDNATSRRRCRSRVYVDAMSLFMVQNLWDFDVLVMENQFGDILSDLAAGIVGGLGMGPSGEIGESTVCSSPHTGQRR